MPHHGRALLRIADENAARVIALLLRHSGFTVERVSSASELTTGSNRLGVTLVIVATPGGTDPATAFGDFTPEPNRSYALVALVAGDPSGAKAGGADRVVAVPFDPSTLTADIIDAIQSRS